MANHPEPPYWEKAALEYELEYSKARGSTPEAYPDFIHIANKSVPYGGDYNRTIAVNARTPEKFRDILSKAEKLHTRDGAFPPDRFDFSPPVLGPEWESAADSLGYQLKISAYLQAPALSSQDFHPYHLHSPTAEEFEPWYTAQQKANPYCTDQLLKEIVPRQMEFIKVFNPFWLMKDGKPIGWVYCQFHGSFCNIFELELLEEFQGKGLGRGFMRLIRAEAGRRGAGYALAQTTRKIKDFYIKSGFNLASENTILLKK